MARASSDGADKSPRATTKVDSDNSSPKSDNKVKVISLYMTRPYFPPPAAFSAGQAANDDGEKGEDGIENGLADGNDAVHNGHDAASNGIKYRLNTRNNGSHGDGFGKV